MNKISIVTVTFNCDSVIEATIKSVISQTYPNYEYIIIDGKSHDNTLNIIYKYKARIDKLISEPDKGIYDAMNKAINMSTGDWIIFMNAGDVFYSVDAIEKIMSQYDGSADVIYGNALYLYAHFSFIPDFPSKFDMKRFMPFCHQSTFVKTTYHKEHLFDISFKSSGDYNFFYNAFFVDKLKFQAIPVLVSIFDARTGMSKDNHSLSIRENLKIWNNNNLLFRVKIEFTLFVYKLKLFCKDVLFPSKLNYILEKRRLSKFGTFMPTK